MKKRLILPATLMCLLIANSVLSADFNKGTEAYRNGDYETALKNLRPFAERGDADALFNLAIMYNYGRGVQKNYKTAVKLYTLSAEQGYAKAQQNLGTMYEMGQGVQKNAVTAVKWYTLAADQGKASAQYNLAMMYEYGEGVTRNAETAIKWYSLASQKGNADAERALMRLRASMQGKSDIPKKYKTNIRVYNDGLDF